MATVTDVCESRYLTVPMAVRYSGMSRSTLLRLVDEGRLRLFRPRGRVTLLDRQEIDALVRGDVN